MKMIDLTGGIFGRLRVIRRVVKENVTSSMVHWGCICKCGKTTVVSSAALRNGYTKSCGCLNKEIARNINRSHGMRRSSEYAAWCDMKTRCYNKNFKDYSYYGGRGIIVCDKWLNSFEAFISDIGLKPNPSFSLDRIDTNGNYEPSNCRWVSQKEQCRNRRNNFIVEYNNKKMTLAELAELLNIPWHRLRHRLICSGMSPDDAANARVGPKLYDFNGEMVTLSNISKSTGVNYRTLLSRIRKHGEGYLNSL